ncbi:hypothetical protein Mycch_4877 [Mycolicibacterium chubuense NBB4]|uniref:PASTA domain-containing protein n=1 Tax=Mycolicibacterium chubuense (strain NBB4) TaxID=710421 RepID=I4BQL3_MYCCN|nr:hypothetical protein [Mycolicibacterium chubuense]AFM19570.1 hypothetical protein Mycch_4877 [Mycolicibacterium chubuense NBB4]
MGPRGVAAWLLAVAATVALSPPCIAEPAPPAGSAASVIDELKSQGYDVQINWVSGVSNRPLEECRVLAVHNPDLNGPPPETFTTVYVDVSCPNRDDDSFSFGGGIGLGF